MKSILTDKNVSEDIVKIEADVIVTATVLGFIGTRYHQNQPCSFDYEHPSPENFRIWEVLDSLSKSEEKDSNKAKQELMIKIQELWKSIQKTDKDFYDNHGLKDLEVPTEQVPKLRSQNQTLQDVQYNNYLAKRLILDLEKKYPTISSLLKSLDQAIEDYAEELDDYQKFLNVLDAMSIVLDQTDKKIGDHLDDSQSPAWVPGALITGLKGGAGVDFRDRHRQIRSDKAKKWAEKIAKKPENFKSVYQGRGAYTGMVDNPQSLEKYFLRPTRRVIDINNDNKRWHPGSSRPNQRWGLIGSGDNPINLSPQRTEGMGPIPNTEEQDTALKDQHGIVGYIHGMSSAICECIKQGPWCTPFEMAIGEQTTKMASCFACCTYMYAAGYPPSSMHLGRGESWVPPSLQTQKDGEFPKKDDIHGFKGLKEEFDLTITSSVLSRWHREVFGYMVLGVEYLQNTKEKNLKNNKRSSKFKEFIAESHLPYLGELKYKLKSLEKSKTKNNPIISKEGGNLFLDALTVHQSDWKRIKNTLSPIFKTTETEGKEKLKNFGKKKSGQLSLSQSYSTSSSPSTLPKMVSTDEPVLLNGMKVIFDESASVYPVSLTQND